MTRVKKERTTKEERMQVLQEKLEKGVREIFESEKYKEYIATMAKFPRYSINNCILIASQCPTATLVCGYKKWQTDFNRFVNKDEQGIMILAPVKYKADVQERVYDEEHHPVIDENGKEVTEAVTREFQGFRPVYVFDVAQTTGDPVPSLTTMLDERVEDFERIRDVLIAVSPVPISFEPIDSGANGYFSYTAQRIVVKDSLPQLQTIKTMLHEIAHATLGHGSKEDKWDRETKEVQAESVAFWCSGMIGLDSSDYSFGYISGWSKNREVTELMENLELIKTTADTITTAIEKELFKKQIEVEKVEEKAEISEEQNTRRKKSR